MRILYFIILIFLFYNLNGYVHEYIYVELHITESNFLTMLQFFTMSCEFLILEHNHNKEQNKYSKNLTVLLIICGIMQAISKSFVNIASLKLSYSTEISIRSCKIIPTVIFNSIIFGRLPKTYIILSTLLMGIGTFGMAITDVNMKNIFSVEGLIYGISGLILDSIVCNIESVLFDRTKISEYELIVYEYTFGYIILFINEVINKEYILLLMKILDDYVIFFYIILFCITGALAIYTSLLCTKQYGIITTVMITSSRKLMGILMSFLLFKNKAFSITHAISLFSITAGSIIYVLVKSNRL